MASASRRARGRFPESLADVYLWKISTAVSREIGTRALILRPRRSQMLAEGRDPFREIGNGFRHRSVPARTRPLRRQRRLGQPLA
jgi:hypothetical protein